MDNELKPCPVCSDIAREGYNGSGTWAVWCDKGDGHAIRVSSMTRTFARREWDLIPRRSAEAPGVREAEREVIEAACKWADYNLMGDCGCPSCKLQAAVKAYRLAAASKPAALLTPADTKPAYCAHGELLGRDGCYEPDPLSATEASECICKGNWRLIVNESLPDFDKVYYRDGKEYRFAGVVHASDDYYYLMTDKEGVSTLLSCVGSIVEGHGFAKAPDTKSDR